MANYFFSIIVLPNLDRAHVYMSKRSDLPIGKKWLYSVNLVSVKVIMFHKILEENTFSKF